MHLCLCRKNGSLCFVDFVNSIESFNMKKIFYEKKGRRYVPVAEYDNEMLDSFPKGTHIVMCYPGGQSRRYNIDPDYAAMIAAGRVAEDAICAAMVKADEVQPHRKALTEAERDAWNNLIAVWGDEARSLRRPCVRDVAEAAVQAMQVEADKLMRHESVRKAYEHFQLVCELVKERENG
jgi:hypothetical protein